jgi:hypothetical protein
MRMKIMPTKIEAKRGPFLWGSLSPETELVIGLGEQISPQSIGLDVL